LDLVTLEELRQVVLILRDDACQRDGEVVSQRKIRFAARLVLATPKDLENKLIALLAVFPEERLDVLERRGFERFEAVALVHLAHDAHHVLAAADLVREEVACAARGLG
jgi:hypothetical protein